ncbi:hypothetical protein BDB01DRAFT_778023 [Pilobolus umbonatus]|nr:hypothetical protein BDB01DRAFT_778023 [Pilobolus umbonatus]
MMFLNGSTAPIPDCHQRFIREVPNIHVSKCYVFETNGTYVMTSGNSTNPDSILRFDIYWSVESLENMTRAALSEPSVAIGLYHPLFSVWKDGTIGDSEKEEYIALGFYRSTSTVNHSSSLFFYQELYRAIKKWSIPALFGLEAEYIDIRTLPTTELTWRTNNSSSTGAGRVPRNAYHGYFSVQLAKSSIEVREEVRQHTILASAALAGGCYGLLTTIYIVLFGMNRMTPWGLVHHIPMFVVKTKVKRNSECSLLRQKDEKERKPYTHVPWFFKSRFTRSDGKSKCSTKKVYRNMIMNRFRGGPFSGSTDPADQNEHREDTDLNNHSHSNTVVEMDYQPEEEEKLNETCTALKIQKKQLQREEQSRSKRLFMHIHELETVLGEYFISTLYLDEIRSKDDMII